MFCINLGYFSFLLLVLFFFQFYKFYRLLENSKALLCPHDSPNIMSWDLFWVHNE
jgi:hypothetical protein